MALFYFVCFKNVCIWNKLSNGNHIIINRCVEFRCHLFNACTRGKNMQNDIWICFQNERNMICIIRAAFSCQILVTDFLFFIFAIQMAEVFVGSRFGFLTCVALYFEVWDSSRCGSWFTDEGSNSQNISKSGLYYTIYFKCKHDAEMYSDSYDLFTILHYFQMWQ